MDDDRMMMDGDDDSTYDATDALFSRGDFLRKLRELEAQDEAERQLEREEEGVDANSDTLHYESQYLQNQRYWDDYKHVNYRFIDFGCIGSGGSSNNGPPQDDDDCKKEQQQPSSSPLPLLIEQDRAFGKGGFVWDAGFILAEHVIHEREEWKRVRGVATCTATLSTTTITPTACTSGHNNNKNLVNMVELGAGTGITGLMIAAALPQDVHVSLTDLPELMPLLRTNLAHNKPQLSDDHGCNIPLPVEAFPLAWGTNVTANYDVVLGADVVAGIYDPIRLAKTISDLCHEHTVVYLAVNRRLLEVIATFEVAMTRLFGHVERRQPISRNRNPSVSILVATGKRSKQ